TGVYSQIIAAMFEHKQLSYLENTIKLQARFAFWSISKGMEDAALEALERISDACVSLQNPEYKDVYGSARLAINVAQIGIYALAMGVERAVNIAVERYSSLRRRFLELYPDLHFAGDFYSAERELI